MKQAAVLALLCACTTLGPNPATTGVSAIPVGRPGVDAQVGAVPAFYMSQSAQGEAKGAAVPQASALVEPDRWLKLPGLVIGGRMFGQSGDTIGEPYVGYRQHVGERVSLGIGAFGGAKRSTKKLASYHATRIGSEASADAELVAFASWLSLHAQGSVSATRIMTSGTYCVDPGGIAMDCDDQNPANNMVISGKQTGIYPAGTATVTLAASRATGFVRSASLALLGSVGTMPIIKDGTKQGNGAYQGLGLLLTLGVGD